MACGRVVWQITTCTEYWLNSSRWTKAVPLSAKVVAKKPGLSTCRPLLLAKDQRISPVLLESPAPRPLM